MKDALPDLDALNQTLEAILRDGYVVLENLIPRAGADVIEGELEPWFEQTPTSIGDFHGWRTTRVNGLLNKAPAVQALALHPLMLGLAEALLLPACDCIQLNLTQAIRVHPGERAQAPHRDEEMWPADTKGAHWLLNVMWAIDDFTEENGATRVWPRSHTEKLGRLVTGKKSRAIEMPKGSALIYLGSLTHGAGANRSEAPRTGVVVSYCLGWLKTYENQFLAYPKEVARTFPESLQRLIGYRWHRPNLGGWEGQDPIDYLADGPVYTGHTDALTPEIQRRLRRISTATRSKS